jgi:hypothetical protein
MELLRLQCLQRRLPSYSDSSYAEDAAVTPEFTKWSACFKWAPRIFHVMGAGGGDPEAIYTLYLILKIMLQNHVVSIT